MPKDEFDFDDPLELNGVAFYTDEDTQREMAECFAEEFLMLGYNHKQLLAMFRNPHYLGLNMVLQNKGEGFVKEIISEVFARWGKQIHWPVASSVVEPSPHSGPLPHGKGEPRAAGNSLPDGQNPGAGERSAAHSCTCGSGGCSAGPSEQSIPLDGTLTDPLGNPVPNLNL